MSHRRLLWSGMVLGLLLAMAIGRVSAANSRQGDQCVIGAGEVVESDLYVLCNNLSIAGTVRGDLAGAAFTTTLVDSGHIEGDIWLIGGQLRIDGAVDDDIHFAGGDLDLNSAALQPRGDLAAIALNVEVWEGARVPGDVLVLGYQTLVLGEVGGNVDFNGSALVVSGTVDGDVFATVSGGDASPSFIPIPFPFSVTFQPAGLTVSPAGRVDGDLNYSGPRAGDIEGTVAGQTNFELVLPRPDLTQAVEAEQARPGDLIASYLRAVLTDILALMAAGVLVMAVAPAWIREPSAMAPRQVASSFGWGLILTLLSPPVALILILASILLLVLVSAVTLGGFMWMGLMLLVMLNIVVIGGLLFVILFLARLVISDLIGRRLGRRLIQTTDRLALNLLSLLLGTVVYALLSNIPLPYVGLIINAVGIFIGLGAIALHARQLYQRTIRGVYPAPQPQTIPAPRALPHPPALDALLGNTPAPPPDSNEPPGPGMSNLPEGFDWWKPSDQGGDRGEQD
jgi:cytoskeletal protein CcmA (bactofilin family)